MSLHNVLILASGVLIGAGVGWLLGWLAAAVQTLSGVAGRRFLR